MTFQYSNKLEVIFSPEVERFLLDLKGTHDYKHETGGILAGVLDSGSTITITDVTTPQPKDICQRFRFRRSGVGHQTIMDQLWEESGYRKMYLGEWHTHRESIPSPSRVDISGWKSIAKKRQNSPWMLFLILGQQSMRIWTADTGAIKELSLDAE